MRTRTVLAAPCVPIRERDVVRLSGGETTVLVVACDANGGVGPKSHDRLSCSGDLLGRFAARVPLMEVVAAGARPVLLSDTLSVEMEPTGVGVTVLGVAPLEQFCFERDVPALAISRVLDGARP